MKPSRHDSGSHTAILRKTHRDLAAPSEPVRAIRPSPLRDAWLARKQGGPLVLYVAGFHYVCINLLRALTERNDLVREFWSAIPRYESLTDLGLELNQVQLATKEVLDAAALTLPQWEEEGVAPGTLVAFAGAARTIRAANRTRNPDTLTIYLKSRGRRLSLPLDNRWVARAGGARCLDLDAMSVCGICVVEDDSDGQSGRDVSATPIVVAAPMSPEAMSMNPSRRHYRLCTVILPPPTGRTVPPESD